MIIIKNSKLIDLLIHHELPLEGIILDLHTIDAWMIEEEDGQEIIIIVGVILQGHAHYQYQLNQEDIKEDIIIQILLEVGQEVVVDIEEGIVGVVA